MLSGSYGEREVNAYLTLIEKGGEQMKKDQAEIAANTFGATRKKVTEEMSKGIGQQTKLLEQAWGSLKNRSAKLFEPTTIKFYEWIRSGIHRLTDSIDEKLPTPRPTWPRLGRRLERRWTRHCR